MEAACLLPAPTLAELLVPSLSMAAPRAECSECCRRGGSGGHFPCQACFGPVQEGCELCLGGGAISSGECCLAQLGPRPTSAQQEKKQPPKQKWPLWPIWLSRWELGTGLWVLRECVSYILAQGGKRRGFSFEPSTPTPPTRKFPLPFIYALGGWRSEWGWFGAPGVHSPHRHQLPESWLCQSVRPHPPAPGGRGHSCCGSIDHELLSTGSGKAKFNWEMPILD